MPGSDRRSGSSGATSAPHAPPKSRKCKRGDVAVAACSEPSLRCATRSSASAPAVVDGTVRLARERDPADPERMGKVILGACQTRSVPQPDDTSTPRSKNQKHKMYRSGERRSMRIVLQVSYLVDAETKKRVGTDPDMFQASVPEWTSYPSENDVADYANDGETLQKLGTIVSPLNMDFSPTDEGEKARKERVDMCKCSRPRSENCVRVHVEKAKRFIKDQLGEEVFRNCGLDAKGEWTAKEKKKLDNIGKSIPQNKHKDFMKIASERFRAKKTKVLAYYYYNVFLPRRLARLTRSEAKNDEDVDTNDEDSNQDEDNDEGCSKTKRKRLRYSSKRGRK